jgi:branched-chain amino acid transport system ATP-binding protein
MGTALEVTGLRAAYSRIPILHGIDLSVAEGEFVGILGHNGMGKTTLLRTLIGHVPATAGQIVFDGTDITRWSPFERVRRGLGYVPQGRQIFPDLTVLENLRMGAVAHGNATGEEDVLDDFPLLSPLLHRRGGDLSGGEQQVLAIARCLCGGPRLILFDEPTEGVQPSIIEAIGEALRRLHASRGLTIVLVEQNLDFTAELVERVLIIQKGTIVGELAPEAVRDTEMVSELTGIRL